MFKLNKSNRWIILRIGAIVCLILSLLNIQFNSRSKGVATFFLVDRSLSVTQHEKEISEYINSQVELKNKRDTFSIISFGRDAMIDIPISKEKQKINFNTKIDENATNIEEGLRTALDSYPKGSNKRLVIFTDGVENLDSYRDILYRIEDEKVNIYVYPLYSKEKSDAELQSIIISSNVHEDLPVNVKINSNFKSKGNLYLYRDDKKVLDEEIEIEEGLNTFRYNIQTQDNRGEKLKGEIVISGDSNPHNNTFTTEIRGKYNPKILLIGEVEDRKNIENLLKSFKLDVCSHTTKEVPTSLDYLIGFNEIILANVSHDDIDKEFEDNINYCVKEEGIGLLVVGGENTFSLGGYKGTLLEEMLPVDSHIKGDEKKPNTGIVLAIDSSGSMEDESGGVKKIEMAKKAAISSIEVLEDGDFVGVLGFSDTLEWIVPFGSVADKENIADNIGKLKAGGGTIILPSLEKAERTLSTSDTKINHIILLTDGEGEKEGYEQVVEELNKKDITLSTIAIGEDSDVNFLKQLSSQSGGRDYYVEDVNTIPNIFAKETYIATRKYINEREFIPNMEIGNILFNDIVFPKINGYVSTSLKDDANLILKTDLDEPLLAERQYGLGKVLVWTSDLSGKWSRDLVNWNEFQNVFGRIVEYLLVDKDDGEVDIEMIQILGKVEAFIKTSGNTKSVRMNLLNPDGEKSKYSINQVEKNRYNGEIYLDKVGNYIVNFEIEGEDGDIHRYKRILYLDYSPEYAVVTQGDLDRLEFLNRFEIMNSEDKAFDLPLHYKNYSKADGDIIFLPLALFLFIGDLCMRKRSRGY